MHVLNGMTEIQWHTIKTQEDLESVIQSSHHSSQLIFKHSTRCSISSLVKNRLEKEMRESKPPHSIHLIDVIENRRLSHQVAEMMSVRHESPQILRISDGHCDFHTSHFDVSLQNIPIQKEE